MRTMGLCERVSSHVPLPLLPPLSGPASSPQPHEDPRAGPGRGGRGGEVCGRGAASGGRTARGTPARSLPRDQGLVAGLVVLPAHLVALEELPALHVAVAGAVAGRAARGEAVGAGVAFAGAGGS